MNFVFMDDAGREHGPMDGDTLQKWVEEGVVTRHTKVRNSLMQNWKDAREFDFLADAFAVYRADTETCELRSTNSFLGGFFSKLSAAAPVVGGGDGGGGGGAADGEFTKTAFEYKYLPRPASPILRLCAGLFDLILAAMLFLALFLVGSLAVTAGSDVNVVFNWLFFIFVMLLLSYYSFCLGIMAQTFGMWFWGLMLCREDTSECYMLRAHAFSILDILLGFTSPIAAIVNPAKRGIPEVLTGTMVIGIAAKPRA